MLKVLELRMWSASRPGVATTTCGWLDSSRAWVTMSAHNTAESAQSTSIRQKQTKFMENGNTVWFLQLSIITFWAGLPPLTVNCEFCTGGINSLKAQQKQVNLAHFYTLIKGQLLNYLLQKYWWEISGGKESLMFILFFFLLLQKTKKQKPQPRDKKVVTHSTDNDAFFQTQRFPQDSELLCNLIGQLPEWHIYIIMSIYGTV